MINIIGLEGIPMIGEGDDLGALIVEASLEQGVGIEDGDVLVVTQKVVSKAEGRVIEIKSVEASRFAEELAANTERDPRHVEVIFREAARIVKMRGSILIIETKHGFVCANAGVDLSNIESGYVSLLPVNPDSSAMRIRTTIGELTGADVAVIVTDTWGRPWRLGQVDFAIGVAGMSPFIDYRGKVDDFGYELNVTNIAVADELAAAAELAKGKLKKIPAVIIRGYNYVRSEGSARDIVRPIEEDLFR
jgi:coenzyme F420-0:L-glutamate ligase/coenzyme F420-1:gamma-L-glutamate ligase